MVVRLSAGSRYVNGKVAAMTEWRIRLRQPKLWILVGIAILTLVVLVWFSAALAPMFAAMVIAYLLDGLIQRLERMHIPRLLATLLVMLIVLILIALILFAILPTVADELNALANQVPRLIVRFEEWLGKMHDTYPQFFPGASVQEFLGRLRITVDDQLGRMITVLLAWAGGTFSGGVGVVITLFLTFFILKDKMLIWAYVKRLLPAIGHQTLIRVFNDIDQQMGRFIKGKFIVVILLFLISTLAYLFIGLHYWLLLGILTGISTFIPYIGAIVVAVPVVLVGLVQWGTVVQGGLGTLATYMVVQAVDANYLTPVIIGRETKTHPVAIILAILICGSLWGFWGVFFAVPILVVVKSVLDQVYFPAREDPTRIAEVLLPPPSEGEAGT
jgi:putative permease